MVSAETQLRSLQQHYAVLDGSASSCNYLKKNRRSGLFCRKLSDRCGMRSEKGGSLMFGRRTPTTTVCSRLRCNCLPECRRAVHAEAQDAEARKRRKF